METTIQLFNFCKNGGKKYITKKAPFSVLSDFFSFLLILLIITSNCISSIQNHLIKHQHMSINLSKTVKNHRIIILTLTFAKNDLYLYFLHLSSTSSLFFPFSISDHRLWFCILKNFFLYIWYLYCSTQKTLLSNYKLSSIKHSEMPKCHFFTISGELNGTFPKNREENFWILSFVAHFMLHL